MVPLIFEPFAADLAQRAASLSPNAVLETATGTGVVTRALAPKLSPGASYIVTDLNQPMLDYAASRQAPDSRIKWRQAKRSLGGGERPEIFSLGAVAVGGRANGGAPHLLEEQPGREIVVNIAIAPLVTKDLQQIGRLIILDDITERDELERRLVQADKLSSIGLLAAGVAHEVNTPLAVISTYAQMLGKQVSEDEHKSRLLDKIAKQTFRASEIVNSLLNFSRTSPTTFDELDLNRVIQESLVLIEHQMEKAGIKVQLDLEEHIPLIKGNSGKLQQVFLNLFLNARDAMGAGGTLTVRTRRSGETVGIEVSDTGHGIQPENLSRIFDPFFTTKAIRKGTGLGLSVTYGIVREHNGVIEVESQPGEGTRFRLEFPLARKAVHA
jgi:signal transduction histidine kinase